MTMALISDLQALWLALNTLRDDVLPLRLLVTEDRPDTVAPRPVQDLADSLDEVFGRLQEAIDSIAPVIDNHTGAHRADEVAPALGRCNQAMLEFRQEWTDRVSAYHSLRQVNKSALERGPRWRSWAKSTTEGVHGCEVSSHQVQHALLVCWQSLGDLATVSDKSPRTPAAVKER